MVTERWWGRFPSGQSDDLGVHRIMVAIIYHFHRNPDVKQQLIDHLRNLNTPTVEK